MDGNSLVYRAFYAVPTDLVTTSGQVTNAVHGFTSMLVNLLRDHSPSGVAVAFDRPEPTFRDDLVADYKANRPASPELLLPQFPLVRRVLDAMGILTVESPGFEADDLLATLATEARDAGRDVVVVTGDRDSFQLVEDPHVRVMYTRKGISDTVMYDEAGITERYGVPPSQYPVLAALRGDPSDNLKGVPGVGEKTATKLVVTYGDLDAIFAHLDELTPKLRESLAESEQMVRTNAVVIPLRRDVELPLHAADITAGIGDPQEIGLVFAELELKSLWKRLAPLLGASEETPPHARSPVSGAGALKVDPEELGVQRAVSVLEGLSAPEHRVGLFARWTGEPGRSSIAGMALSDLTEDIGDATPPVYWLAAPVLADGAVRRALSMLFDSGGARVVAHGAKELMRSLAQWEVDLRSLELDSAVAAYLLDPSSGRYRLEDVLEGRLGVALDDTDPGTGAAQLELGEPEGQIGDDAAKRAVLLGALVVPLRQALEQSGLTRLYDEVEHPLVRVLARMEVVGIGVDADELHRLARVLSEQCTTLEAEIHGLAGGQFNVNSTQQLRAVLYDQLGLSPGRKTKTGFSTDAATLERIRDQHPIVDTLLRYREVEKLRSTYGESLIAEVAGDGRIHATFHQTVARTGRLSSDRPNLHNIPVRSEVGRQLRRAFVPGDGARFLVADYDQIELRVIAHLSSDPGLVEAFAQGLDIHRSTASRVFGVPADEVTATQRNRAKMVSYGLAYGMEAYGLGRRLAIETGAAQEILDAYFDAFPSVRSYMEQTVAEARSKGYTVTLLGRRRPLPDLNSPNRPLRMAAERQAMNAGIQGLAADLFKVALVRLDTALAQAGLRSRLVLQVHDEVLVEVPADEEAAVGTLVPDVMSSVAGYVGLVVPLEVSAAWGSSWADAKG